MFRNRYERVIPILAEAKGEAEGDDEDKEEKIVANVAKQTGGTLRG